MAPDVPREVCDERYGNIITKVDETHRVVCDVRRLLLGNGQPGVFEQVRDLRQWAEHHELAHTNDSGLTKVLGNHAMWKLLAAVFVGFGSIATAIAAILAGGGQ